VGIDKKLKQFSQKEKERAHKTKERGLKEKRGSAYKMATTLKIGQQQPNIIKTVSD
jgi:hypothetical protein